MNKQRIYPTSVTTLELEPELELEAIADSIYHKSQLKVCNPHTLIHTCLSIID